MRRELQILTVLNSFGNVLDPFNALPRRHLSGSTVPQQCTTKQNYEDLFQVNFYTLSYFFLEFCQGKEVYEGTNQRPGKGARTSSCLKYLIIYKFHFHTSQTMTNTIVTLKNFVLFNFLLLLLLSLKLALQAKPQNSQEPTKNFNFKIQRGYSTIAVLQRIQLIF